MAINKREKEKSKRKRTDAMALVKDMKEQAGGESTCLTTPEGWEEWKPEVGVYEIDVMEYVAGKHNRRADEGELHWECEFRQHWIPCMDGKRRPYVCLLRWNQKCPACERNGRPHDGDDDDFKRGMRGRVMHAMIIKVLTKDRKAQDDKFRLWVANNYNRGKGFMEQLADLLEANEKYKGFPHWDDGASLRLTCKEESMQSGGKYVYVARIDFVEREQQYGPEVEDRLVCLDDLLVRKSYEQLKNVIEFGLEEGEQEEPPSAKAPAPNGRGASHKPKAPPPKEEEEEEEEKSDPELAKGDWVLHARLGRCQVAKVYPDGTVTLEDKAGRTHKGLDAADCDPLAEAPEEEPKKTAKDVAKEEPEADEWEEVGSDEPEEDEEPEEKPAKAAKRK